MVSGSSAIEAPEADLQRRLVPGPVRAEYPSGQTAMTFDVLVQSGVLAVVGAATTCSSTTEMPVA